MLRVHLTFFFKYAYYNETESPTVMGNIQGDTKKFSMRMNTHEDIVAKGWQLLQTRSCLSGNWNLSK